MVLSYVFRKEDKFMEVQFVESKNLKEKPTGALGFGKYYTDYMFVLDWDAGQEWHDARVVPYGPCTRNI